MTRDHLTRDHLKILGPVGRFSDYACDLCQDAGPSRRRVELVAHYDGKPQLTEAVLCASCRRDWKEGLV